MDAYQVLPEGTGPFAGVIIIHEISGLNDNMRDIARRFAKIGYAALAVDYFSTGNRAMCMLRIFNGMLLKPLDNSVAADLRAALDFFRAQPDVDAARVGAVGFCMGGTFALQLACLDDKLRVASVFYGQNPRPLEKVAQACPVVGSYPEKDFTVGAARKLEVALTEYDVPHDIKIYPDTGHSFFNNGGKRYHTEAAADAWKRMLAFFEIYLKTA